MKRTATISERSKRYDSDNAECAAIILQNVGGFGGEGSLQVEWATRVIERNTPTVRGPLFLRPSARGGALVLHKSFVYVNPRGVSAKIREFLNVFVEH
jgi:hypothetical protein